MSAGEILLNAAARSVLGGFADVAIALTRSLTKSTEIVEAAAEAGVAELTQEVEKQRLRLGFELQQAKILQELAIAERIASAETVELEEFYDRSAKGHAGVKSEGGSTVLGIGGEGQTITKRILRFSGHQSAALDGAAKRAAEAQKLLQKPSSDNYQQADGAASSTVLKNEDGGVRPTEAN